MRSFPAQKSDEKPDGERGSRMRIAVVADIHGNRTAFEAVLADLREMSPDLIFHGGDLAHGGASPAEIVDRIRALGWQGVMGNVDEMMFRPEALTEFAEKASGPRALFAVIGEMAAWSREVLGEERIAWLSGLPRMQIHGTMALVHASPESMWRSPGPGANDTEFESVYGSLGKTLAVYGHIHWPFVRRVGEITVANTGSVGLPLDGDRRASYLLVEDSVPVIQRVEYDIDAETKNLSGCGLPHADWVARTLKSASFEMP